MTRSSERKGRLCQVHATLCDWGGAAAAFGGESRGGKIQSASVMKEKKKTEGAFDGNGHWGGKTVGQRALPQIKLRGGRGGGEKKKKRWDPRLQKTVKPSSPPTGSGEAGTRRARRSGTQPEGGGTEYTSREMTLSAETKRGAGFARKSLATN